LQPGERIALFSPLRREWLLADLAAAVQGAVAVAVDPDLPGRALAAALAKTAPRAVFLSGPTALERVLSALLEARGGARPSAGDAGGSVLSREGKARSREVEVIAFDGPVPVGAALLSEVLDLGGTLDTAERAVAFRARAREVTPGQSALEHVQCDRDGIITLGSFTHGDVAAYLQALWSGEPARQGDLAYLAATHVTTALRLALLAFVGDGLTTVAFGDPDRAAEEIAALRPHKIVAPPGALHGIGVGAAATSCGQDDGKARVRSWLRHALGHIPLGRRDASREGGTRAGGGRARWIRSSVAPFAATSRQTRVVPAVHVTGSGVDSHRGGAE
jgi:hypothetical protein